MVIGIMGDSCTGKSTVAERVAELTGAEIVTGKEYLRLAKSESMAQALFRRKLQAAMTEGTLIYVISEKEQLDLLPEKALRVLVTAELETIKRRFARRMNGSLPGPVGEMLERKYGQFEKERFDLRIVNEDGDPADACAAIAGLLN